MLVLSRKPGERIRIGDNIEVTVVAVRGDRVRLGFEAPREIAIFRNEVRPDVVIASGVPVTEAKAPSYEPADLSS